MLTLWQIFVIILLVILLVLSAILISISAKRITNISGGDGNKIGQRSSNINNKGGILYNPEDNIQPNNGNIPAHIGIGPIAAARQQAEAQQQVAQQLREDINIITELYQYTRSESAIIEYGQELIDDISNLYDRVGDINNMIENNHLIPDLANDFHDSVEDAGHRYDEISDLMYAEDNRPPEDARFY